MTTCWPGLVSNFFFFLIGSGQYLSDPVLKYWLTLLIRSLKKYSLTETKDFFYLLYYPSPYCQRFLPSESHLDHSTSPPTWILCFLCCRRPNSRRRSPLSNDAQLRWNPFLSQTSCTLLSSISLHSSDFLRHSVFERYHTSDYLRPPNMSTATQHLLSPAGKLIFSICEISFLSSLKSSNLLLKLNIAVGWLSFISFVFLHKSIWLEMVI